MDLDFWRNVVYTAGKASLLSLLAANLITISVIRKTPRALRFLIFYLWASLIEEALVLYLFSYQEITNETFSFINKFYALSEIGLLGAYFFFISRNKVTRAVSLSVSCVLFATYVYRLLTAAYSDNEYLSAGLSFGHLCIIQLVIYPYFRQDLDTPLNRKTTVRILLLLTAIYALSLGIFMFMPHVVSYSRILANQIETFRILLQITFYTYVGYTLLKVSKLR